jgi:hypothetical protein
MYLDTDNLYSDAQALTATAVSTNVIDHGADNNIGLGEPMVAVIAVDVALDDGNGNETYSALLETDDNAGFTSGTTVGTFPTMTRGDAAGTKYILPIPQTTAMERFSRVSYTLGGTSPTATVTAALIPQANLDGWVANPKNYTITS